MHILLSRTDSIGDVMLTLPMTGLIKKQFPKSKITFLGSTYTKSVLDCCTHIDEFLDWNLIKNNRPEEVFKELNIDYFVHVFPRKEIAKAAKKANIKFRVGTFGRAYHFLTCNKLIRFSRKRSDLHESQLNLKLIEFLGISPEIDLNKLVHSSGFTKFPALPETYKSKIDDYRINVILHPKSKGSAVEWGLKNYATLIKRLEGNLFNVFITGTEEEGRIIGNTLPFEQKNVTNLLGKLSLEELIAFINSADCLVAASTGPLHIAGLQNKVAIGLYSARRPIHPGRWAPLGTNSHALIEDEDCLECGKGSPCDCIEQISIERVAKLLQKPSPPSY